MLDRLGRLTRALACLAPPADQLEVFVVNETGRLVVYARVPGVLIGPGAEPLPAGRVILQHYYAADQP